MDLSHRRKNPGISLPSNPATLSHSAGQVVFPEAYVQARRSSARVPDRGEKLDQDVPQNTRRSSLIKPKNGVAKLGMERWIEKTAIHSQEPPQQQTKEEPGVLSFSSLMPPMIIAFAGNLLWPTSNVGDET
mmetsp:Transcript_31949/g.73411  ORF Transcript_31949/g.73411 Transcript_31949/m.73411 type:complete len:131 (-) Transcript_31949:348-740(-)